MQIRAEEDLFHLEAAEFYCEAWGGHPGTSGKRITVNGRSTYFLPRAGTEEGHCVYFYPAIALKLTDLVNGFNAFQFAVDQGNTFWGHMLVDNAAIRVALTNTHPDLVKAGLAGFTARVGVEPMQGREGWRVCLVVPAEFALRIASVDFQGWYYGYDENGNLQWLDWHGFTKRRQFTAHLGTVADSPAGALPAKTGASAGPVGYGVTWDTSMLAAQTDVAVRALVRFTLDTNLVFLSAATRGLEIKPRADSEVVLFKPHDLPAPFWSRAGQRRVCSFDLDLDPVRIERAELHVVSWTGGAGTVKDYFKVNGAHFAVAEGQRHEVMYSRLPVEPTQLRRGRNTVELLSDTEHHGIEILLPGPALMVRCRAGEH